MVTRALQLPTPILHHSPQLTSSLAKDWDFTQQFVFQFVRYVESTLCLLIGFHLVEGQWQCTKANTDQSTPTSRDPTLLSKLLPNICFQCTSSWKSGGWRPKWFLSTPQDPGSLERPPCIEPSWCWLWTSYTIEYPCWWRAVLQGWRKLCLLNRFTFWKPWTHKRCLAHEVSCCYSARAADAGSWCHWSKLLKAF